MSDSTAAFSTSNVAIEGVVAFVTGANRGIGAALVEALMARGASRVYATARKPQSLEWLSAKYGSRLVPVELDVRNDLQVAAAVAKAPDVRLLINNAGLVSHAFAPMSDTTYLSALREELNTNVVGLHSLTLAFTPVLKANSTPRAGSAIVNFSSVAGLAAFPSIPTYSASKAAVHSLTQAWRAALGTHGIAVHGVYPGPIDTDMARDIDMPKTSPDAVAHAVLDAIAAGTEDVFPDPMSKEVGANYLADPKAVERAFAAQTAA